jgi:O-antigen/teichoic acid export membrane protein
VAIAFSLNIVFVLVIKMGVVGVFVASAATEFVWAMLLAGILLRHHRVSVDRAVARELTSYQWPLIPGDLVSFVSRQAERVLLRVLNTLSSVGILEMGYKFPPLIGLLVTEPFLQAWRTKSMELAERENSRRIIGEMYTNYLFVSVLAGLLLAVNLDTVLHLLTPAEFWPAVVVGRLGIISTILTGSVSYFEFGLLFTRRTRRLSTIVGIKALIKLALSYFFISHWGLHGAVLSAVITDMIALAWVARASQRAYPITLEWRRIAVIGAAAAGLFVFTRLVGNDVQRCAEGAVGPLHAFCQAHLGARAQNLLTVPRLGAGVNLILDSAIALLYLAILPYVRPGLVTRVRHALVERARRRWGRPC